jgi:hypothetical protein
LQQHTALQVCVCCKQQHACSICFEICVSCSALHSRSIRAMDTQHLCQCDVASIMHDGITAVTGLQGQPHRLYLCPALNFAAAGALGWAVGCAAATQPGHAGPCSCHCSSRIAAACSCWRFAALARAASRLGAASCCCGASGAAVVGGSTWQHCSWHAGQESAAYAGVAGYVQGADTSAK